MINIDQIRLRDLVVALLVITAFTHIVIGLLAKVINRRTKSVDDFVKVTAAAVTELKITTQVYETEIRNLKERYESTFMVKHTGHAKDKK